MKATIDAPTVHDRLQRATAKVTLLLTTFERLVRLDESDRISLLPLLDKLCVDARTELWWATLAIGTDARRTPAPSGDEREASERVR